MNKLLQTLKEKLDKKMAVYGPFMKTGDPAFVEATGYAGFDFAILDMEHGPISLQNLQNLIRAAQIANIVPIVRVSSEELISKVLDVGAMGVQIPQIKNEIEAKRVIKAAKFYPHGQRGVCRFVRAANYSSKDRKEYFTTSNENLIILQLEGEEAIINIDKILTVERIDILFIGPYDLSQSLGMPGEIDSPEVLEKMKFIVSKAKAKNIKVGTFVDSIEDARKWEKAGILYLSYSVDVGIFLDACKYTVHTLKNPQTNGS